jgi:ubiquinone/menaquinone biosynthesis C-methylase UbiE
VAPAQVIGFDRSARFIDFARRRPRLQVGTVRWVVVDAEQLPFASSSFDRVLLSLVLHHADPRAGVADAAQVDWVDPRPTYIIVGMKPPVSGVIESWS